MTSTEAAIFQLKNLKGKPLKQKLEHIFTYYWIPILVTTAFLIFAISYIVHIATMKDSALSVICINAFAEQENIDFYTQKFAESTGIDTQKYEIWISPDVTISESDPMTSYESSQFLMTLISAQSVDVLAGDLETMTRYFYQDVLADLTDIMTVERQEMYWEYFLYMDLAVMRKLEESPDTVCEFPDPTKPKKMEHPVPVALMLPADGTFTELCYLDATDRVVVSVVVNSLNTPNALTFVDYIME